MLFATRRTVIETVPERLHYMKLKKFKGPSRGVCLWK